MSRNQRLGIVLAAVVAVVVVFVLVSSGGSSACHPSGRPHSYSVTVVNAKPKGGVATLCYKSGQTVDFTVHSDVADEIHVHGYDLKKDVPKDGSVHYSFPASIQGTFVIELESRSQQIASLVVVP